jgi:hypothetical protein
MAARDWKYGVGYVTRSEVDAGFARGPRRREKPSGSREHAALCPGEAERLVTGHATF